MKRILYISIAAIAVAVAVACSSSKQEPTEPVKEPTIMFGIVADDYNIDRKKVESGESWSKILDGYGVGVRKVVKLEELAKDICPLRQIRAGNHYTTFTRQDSVATHLDHLVYEKNLVDYVVFSFVGDSVAVREGKRDVTIKRKKNTAVIKNSLWGAIMAEKLPYALAAEIEDIYEWTIDFFGIQANDSFTVIYDEKFIDTLSVGVGRVWGVKFVHRGKEIYAIPYEVDGKVKYWEKDGTSLRKQVLKAPLKFTRISSGFTNARLHPVLKVYRPHYGVDYSAPAGTPVRTIADGTIIQLGYRGAAGNMIKIKHPGNLTTGYLHLKGYAKGLKVGSRVSQGQVIGYVGSTGRSTGPHLDFRVWKGGTPINPLHIPQTPSEPIAKVHREKFEKVRFHIMAELNGDVPDSMKVTNFKDFQ